MTKSVLIFLLTLLFCGSGALHSQNLTYFYSKDNTKYAPSNWLAKWICLPDASPLDKNQVMLARKTFTVSQFTESKLFITAETHYEVWINGKFVARGPARSDSHHQSYDILDVSSFVKTGNNVIAVLVHFHGIMKSYYGDTYPGLLVQLSLDGQNVKYIYSDNDWKVKKDDAWDSRSGLVNRINANNYSSSYNFNHYEKDWTSLQYDDGDWKNAEYQLGYVGFPGKIKDYVPYAIHQPWFNLIPRDLPPLIEYSVNAKKIFKSFESPQYSKMGQWAEQRPYDALFNSIQDVYLPITHSEVKNLNEFLSGEGSLTITNSYPSEKFTKEPVYHTTIIFDFDKVIDGYPNFVVEGKQGTIVDVNYSPYLIDGNFIPATIINNFSDRVYLSDDKNVWNSSELRTFRYMAVTIRGDQPVVFDKIGLNVQEYPFKKVKPIEVKEDSFIKDLWIASENTLQSITTDGFTDNYQERRQYVQTSFYASLGSYAVHGDSWLQRRYLMQHAQNQLPNGIMPMWAPWSVYDASKQIPGILEANHFWLMGLHDYYLYSGDDKTVRELLSNAERCAEALHALQIKDGLIYKPPYSYWIDWAKLAQGDQNFIINALQLISFQYYAELLTWLHEDMLAKKWQVEADRLQQNLKDFWSEEYKMFADNITNNKLDSNFSEHANALAILSGVSNDEQSDIIINKIIHNRKEKSMEESILFNYWVVEALCKQGNVKAGIEYMKNHYQHMIKPDEHNTLWEYSNLFAQNIGERNYKSEDKFVERSWSTSQGENGYPGMILNKWVLGLRPTEPGMKTIEINSMFSPYENFSGVFPSPEGDIIIQRKKRLIKIIIPKGLRGTMNAALIKDYEIKEITINSERVYPETMNKSIDLESGEYTIEWK